MKYNFKFRINLPGVDFKSIPNIFFVERYKKHFEIYSSIAEKDEVADLLKTLNGVSSVSYTEIFSENVELPKGFLKKPKLDEDCPKDFEKKLCYSKIERPLKEGEELQELLCLPRITPQKFKSLCDRLGNMWGNENSRKSYYDDNIKNYFPYHPEPHSFQVKNDVLFSMQFRRNILVTNKFYTNVIVSASYNPINGDFLDETVTQVHDAMVFLLKKPMILTRYN